MKDRLKIRITIALFFITMFGAIGMAWYGPRDTGIYTLIVMIVGLITIIGFNIIALLIDESKPEKFNKREY